MSAPQAAAGAHDQYTPRERLKALVARAEIDPDFADAVRKDPTAALQRAGFSASEAQGLLQDAQARSAEPLAALRAGCADTTCALSLCPASCFLTIPQVPGVCGGGGGGGPCGIFSFIGGGGGGGGCNIFSVF